MYDVSILLNKMWAQQIYKIIEIWRINYKS